MKKKFIFVLLLLCFCLIVTPYSVAQADTKTELIHDLKIVDDLYEFFYDRDFRGLQAQQKSVITSVYTFKNTPVEVEIIEKDIDESFRENLYAFTHENFPNAVRLAPATAKYNCHSYAWYQRSSNNPYCMRNPSAYYTDGSYVETANPKVGDIICYFSANEFNLHSGVITNILSGSPNNVCGNSNLFEVTSKWGANALYRHKGDECPYTSYGGGQATHVKFYTHIHDYDGHYCYCGQYRAQHEYSNHLCSCGAYTSKHDKYTWVNLTKHRVTCGCGANYEESHVDQSSGPIINANYSKCSLCGGRFSSAIVIGPQGRKDILAINDSENYYRLPNGTMVCLL